MELNFAIDTRVNCMKRLDALPLTFTPVIMHKVQTVVVIKERCICQKVMVTPRVYITFSAWTEDKKTGAGDNSAMILARRDMCGQRTHVHHFAGRSLLGIRSWGVSQFRDYASFSHFFDAHRG